MDFEDHIDAVLVELDDLGVDPGRKAALAAVKLEDPVDVGAGRGAGKDLTRSFLDLRGDLVLLEALVALKDNAVDDRVLANVDDEVAGLGAADGRVGEEPSRVKVLDRLVERRPRICLPRREVRIGPNRPRLETLGSANRDRADHPLRGCNRWCDLCGRWLCGRWLCGRWLCRRWLCTGGSPLLRGKQRRGRSAKDGAHQKQPAGAPVKTHRP